MPHSANNILAALDSELDDDELNVIQDEIEEDPDADKEEDEDQQDNGDNKSSTIRGSVSPPAKWKRLSKKQHEKNLGKC